MTYQFLSTTKHAYFTKTYMKWWPNEGAIGLSNNDNINGSC